MKRFAKSAFWICLLLVLAGMTCRLLWLTSRTETGLETLKHQWRDATIALLVGSQTPIDAREPAEQAEFWLSEVNRVMQSHADSARLTVGAAMVLDSPAPGFVGTYVKSVGTGPYVELDDEEIERAEQSFENRIRDRRLGLMATAAKLDSSNVEWWRLRALLLMDHSVNTFDASPRYANWVEILKECARHDPDNALYDYLSAYFYWESSAEIEYSRTSVRLVVNNAQRFGRGVHCFEQGQIKPFFAVGDAGFSAVAEFLTYTNLPLIEHVQIISSRGIHLRRSSLVSSVWRWQSQRANQKNSAGEVTLPLAKTSHNFRLIDQFTRSSPSTAYDINAMGKRIGTTIQMSSFASKHAESISAEEMKGINELEEFARLDAKVIQNATQELTADALLPGPQPELNVTLNGSLASVISTAALWSSPWLAVELHLIVFTTIALSLTIVLLTTGFSTMVLSHLFKNRNLHAVGPVGQFFALVAAFGVTVVVFSIAPSGVVSYSVQAWLLTILVIVTLAVLLSWVSWTGLRRRAFKFSLRAMLISTFVLCILFALISTSPYTADTFARIPFDLSIPARSCQGLDAESLENAIRPLGRSLWAVLQWKLYYGEFLTVVLWTGFVAVLLHLKLRRARRGSGSGPHTFVYPAGALLRMLGRSTITLSALMLVVYLVLAFRVVDTVEQEFQRQMAFARQPDTYWTKVEKTVEKVRADPVIMRQLRREVRAEMSERARINGQ